MPKCARVPGLLDANLPEISFKVWQEKMNDSWFETDAAFTHYIVKRKIKFPEHLKDTLTIRAVAVFMRYGVPSSFAKCPKCKGEVKVVSRTSGEKWATYSWSCKSAGHDHLDEPVNNRGVLKHVPINSWMPFLHFVNHLRLNTNLSDARSELKALYGNIKDDTFVRWKRLYQESLGEALQLTGSLVIGGSDETCVADETVIGVDKQDGWTLGAKGISKHGAEQKRTTARRTQKLVKNKVLKRLPARTVYRTESVQKGSYKLVMKSSIMKVAKKPTMKRPAANLKSNGLWLWVGVRVGIGSKVCTHENGLKRVTYKFLPRKADSKEGKPRGLLEIQDALQSRIAKGSTLVTDAWSSTESAIKKLGYKHPPGIVHENGYRDPKTGFRSNDAESENSRLKRCSRKRYGQLSLNEGELSEYCFYINLGSEMRKVSHGLAVASGGVVKNAVIS